MNEHADLELDCRGLRCPLPIIELGKNIARVDPGQVVAVIATDPAARYDIPAWCRMRGQEFLGEESVSDSTPRYLVRRLS